MTHMKTSHLIIAGLALGLVSSSFAQPGDRPGRGGQGRGPRHGPIVILALDTNKDRVLSADEIAAAASSLKTLDTNNDGAITTEELRPQRPGNAPAQRPANRPARGDAPRNVRPMNPVMLALDADEDHALSATEIANAPTSLAAIDANKDGQLTDDELRPLPPTD